MYNDLRIEYGRAEVPHAESWDLTSTPYKHLAHTGDTSKYIAEIIQQNGDYLGREIDQFIEVHLIKLV